jgi:uncharacterized protein
VKRVFADSNYFLALLNNRDELHPRATEITPSVSGCLLTTTWILSEVLDALCKLAHRKLAADFVRDLRSDPDVIIFPATQELFDAGFELFSKRIDKEWSLTDCISFVVMEQNKLHEALSADHHFQQAGFKLLL